MRRIAAIAISAALFAGAALAEETVPSTVEGGSEKFKDGGTQIGEGFRGVGRGIKKVFKGERSKEDFKEAEKIGTGARDVGLGTAGVGRGVGRSIKKGFTDDEPDTALEDRPSE